MLLFSRQEKAILRISAGIALSLTLLALFMKVDQAIEISGLSIKVSSTFSVLGRQLIILDSDQPMIALLFGITAFWIVGSLSNKTLGIFGPAALMITSLLAAALSVEPFLYASLLIEGAALVIVMLFTYHRSTIKQGVLRFLVFQTIGMPLMLLTGWMLSGLETGTANPEQVNRAITFMGLGFAFILAIFPLYSWVPMLAEEEDPYISGFVFLLLTTTGLFFILTFLDRFSWLIEDVEINRLLIYAGVLMVSTGGVWAAFQKNIARMFGYAIIVENGFALIAIGLITQRSLGVFANLFLCNSIAFGLWTLGLKLIKDRTKSLNLVDVRGSIHQQYLAAIAIVVAQFSIGGLPLLAGFPLRVVLIEELSKVSGNYAWFVIPGIAGVWSAGIYTLYTLI